MISLHPEEVDLYCDSIEQVIGMLNSIDYSVDPYHSSQNIEKTPQHCVGYSKARLKLLQEMIQNLKNYDKD